MNMLWLDTETTGFDHKKHGIVQLAIILEVNGEIIRQSFKTNPGDVEYTEVASRVNGITKEMAMSETPIKTVVLDLFVMLRNYVHLHGKFVLAGYCPEFDARFFGAVVESLGGKLDEILEKYSPDKTFLNVLPLAKSAMMDSSVTVDHKLTTMLDYFQIVHNREKMHTAMEDIERTRDLHLKIQGLNGGKV